MPGQTPSSPSSWLHRGSIRGWPFFLTHKGGCRSRELPEAKLGVGELCLLTAVCVRVCGGARVSPWGQGGCAEATSSSARGKVGVCLQLGVSGAALPWMGLEDGCPRPCVSG